MSVSAERAIEDMYWPVQLTEVDERVVRDGWVYYVRAVKLRRDLYPGGRYADAHPVARLLNLVVDIVVTHRPWKVGIACRGEISTFNDERVRILLCEQLPEGVTLEARIAELVRQVRAGAIAPS